VRAFSFLLSPLAPPFLTAAPPPFTPPRHLFPHLSKNKCFFSKSPLPPPIFSVLFSLSPFCGASTEPSIVSFFNFAALFLVFLCYSSFVSCHCFFLFLFFFFRLSSSQETSSLSHSPTLGQNFFPNPALLRGISLGSLSSRGFDRRRDTQVF